MYILLSVACVGLKHVDVTQLKAQQEDCQRIERERDLACRSWQLHFDNAQEYTRQLGAANAEVRNP